MCDNSMKTCAHALYFIFLHLKALSYAERPDYLPDCIAILGGIISVEGIDLRALCNLWGRYDLKTKKKGSFSTCNCHFGTQNQV